MFPLFDTGVIDTGGKFAASVVDTSGKFAAGINNTSGIGGKFATGVVYTGGKFATGVVDTGGAPWLAKSLRIFEKIWIYPHADFRGLGEDDSRKKAEAKNLVTLSPMRLT